MQLGTGHQFLLGLDVPSVRDCWQVGLQSFQDRVKVKIPGLVARGIHVGQVGRQHTSAR